MQVETFNTWTSSDVQVRLYSDGTSFSVYDTKYELVLTERHEDEDDGEVFESFRCFSEHDRAHPTCKVWRTTKAKRERDNTITAFSDYECGPSGIVREAGSDVDPRIVAAKVVAEL